MRKHRKVPANETARSRKSVLGSAAQEARGVLRRLGVGIGAAGLLLGGPAGVASAAKEPAAIAIVDFAYVDTSGEVQDQTAEHQKRLDAFMLAIRTDLAKSGKYRVVSISCGSVSCSSGGSNPSALVAESRRAGARLLLLGGIHKESTLVQWAKVQLVDIRNDRVVLDRLLTFRGDSDEAWQRAEAFLAKDLEAQDIAE